MNVEKVDRTCLLCCQNRALTTTTTPSSTSTSSCSARSRASSAKFRHFFDDVDNVNNLSPPSVDAQIKDETEIDLCLNCRKILTPAVEAHGNAMETEQRVGKLQREILKELKNLQGQLGQFYVEMQKVEEVLQTFPDVKAEASVKLREKLFGVVRDLQLYNAEWLPKIICKNEPIDGMEEETGEMGVLEHLELGMAMDVDTGGTYDDDHFGTDDQSDENQSDCDDDDHQCQETKPEIEKDNSHCLDQPLARGHGEVDGDDDQNFCLVDDDDDDNDNFSDNSNGSIYGEDEEENETESEEELRKPPKRKAKTKPTRKEKRPRIMKSSPQTPKNFPETEGMQPFKKSVVSRILSTKGVTFLHTSLQKKDPSFFEPFKQNPMKFDSSTDTISVGGIPIIIDEKQKSLKCSSCALEFCYRKFRIGAEIQVHEHILGHHLQTLKCPVCDKAMTKVSNLASHLLSHEDGIPCDICGRPFGNERKKMIRHKISHMNARERAEATARGEGTTLFAKYLRMSKKEQNCGDEVISTLKEIIAKDKTSEWKRKLICRVIKRGAKQTDKDSPTTKFPILYDQATDKLSVSGVEIFMNETEVCLECSSCSVKFHGLKVKQKAELKMHTHILFKHLDALRCPFPAEQCTSSVRLFDTVAKYNRHMRSYHPKEEAVCETCGKIFKNGENLRSHRALHEKAKPKSTKKLDLPLSHKCSTCGKGFWNKPKLERHLVSHLLPEQKELFVCNRCGKKFSLIYYLNRHQKVTCFEKGQEPPKVHCQFCSSIFKTEYHLQLHIPKMHPENTLEDEKPFQCSMCPQRFKTEWTMETHERKKHSVVEGPEGGHVGNEHGNPGSGYMYKKGRSKLIATASGRKLQ